MSGHQRIQILDELNKKDEDYELTVSCLDVSLDEEVEINIALNNRELQGIFDFEKLQSFPPEVSVSGMGFGITDQNIIHSSADVQVVRKESYSPEEEATLKELSDIRRSARDITNKATYESLIIVTFSDQKAKERFWDLTGQRNEVIDGDLLTNRL